MGVYIKGIEMPKENEGIELLIRSDGTVDGVKIIFSNDDDELTTLIEMEKTKATYIPEPHGRLIDGDVLLEESMKDGAFNYVDSWQIADAPAVIEGSE